MSDNKEKNSVDSFQIVIYESSLKTKNIMVYVDELLKYLSNEIERGIDIFSIKIETKTKSITSNPYVWSQLISLSEQFYKLYACHAIYALARKENLMQLKEQRDFYFRFLIFISDLMKNEKRVQLYGHCTQYPLALISSFYFTEKEQHSLANFNATKDCTFYELVKITIEEQLQNEESLCIIPLYLKIFEIDPTFIEDSDFEQKKQITVNYLDKQWKISKNASSFKKMPLDEKENLLYQKLITEMNTFPYKHKQAFKKILMRTLKQTKSDSTTQTQQTEKLASKILERLKTFSNAELQEMVDELQIDKNKVLDQFQ